MKKVFGNLTSRAGEAVGHYKRTELDENIIVMEQVTKATKTAADDLVKHLGPSGGILEKTGLSSKLEATKIGEALVESGNKLKAADSNSNFGTGVVSLGECWRDIGEAQKLANDRVVDDLVHPIKAFVDGPLKEATSMKKKLDSARLEFDTAQRAFQKKNDSHHEEEFHKAERKFQEIKEQCNQKMEDIQAAEDERTEWLKKYVESQIAFHEKCVSLLKSLSSELDSMGARSYGRKRADSDDGGGATRYGGGSSSTPSYGTPTPPPAGGGGGGVSSYGAPTPPIPTYGAPSLPTYGAPPPTNSYGAPPPALPPQRPPRAAKTEQTCRALYDFEGASESELSFGAGDIITIVNKVDDDWYEGELSGAVGIFPSNYVEML